MASEKKEKAKRVLQFSFYSDNIKIVISLAVSPVIYLE